MKEEGDDEATGMLFVIIPEPPPDCLDVYNGLDPYPKEALPICWCCGTRREKPFNLPAYLHPDYLKYA